MFRKHPKPKRPAWLAALISAAFVLGVVAVVLAFLLATGILKVN
jgi:hypothetical protein